MEFVGVEEVMDLLKDHGVTQAPTENEELVYLRMEAATARLHLSTANTAATPAEGARVIPIEAERLPEAIDGLIHKLHLTQVLLVPVGKWRNVFDAVAFSLAENEDWQAVDAMATVELNTRDPLLCESGDYHTVSAFIRALLSDADQPEQAVMLTTSTAPLLIEIVPDGAIRMSFGNDVMADEVLETLEVAPGR